MAYGSAHVRTVILQEETTFGTAPAGWNDGSGGLAFLCIEPNVESVGQTAIENQNYRQRSLATREMVHGLRNCTMSFGVYAHGRGGSAVLEAASATTDYQDNLMENAWGGSLLGLHANLEAGSTTTVLNVAAGQGASLLAGSALFICDAGDSNRGRFVVVGSRSTDALTLKIAAPAAAIAAADTGGAVITSYFDTDALKNQNDAGYITHCFFVRGELADDNQEVRGCKLNLTAIEGLTPGEAPILRFEALCATHDNEGLTAPTGYTDPEGDAPIVTATGSDTFVSIVAYGTPTMVDVECQGFTITPGVISQPVPCLGGVEGRSGYTMTGFDATMIEVVLDYDDAWAIGWEAGTTYHVLVQVGSTAGTAIGWYAPRCEIMEDPKRTVSTDMASVTIKFRCLEDSSTTVATGNQLELYRSKLIYMRSVPIA